MIKNIFKILTIGAVLLFLLLLIQTISNVYASNVFIVWIWFFLLYSPLFILLNNSIKKNTSLEKNTLLYVFTIIFILASIQVPLSLLAYKKTIHAYYISLIYLIPIELFLLLQVKKYIQPITKSTDSSDVLPTKVFISYNHSNSDIANKIYNTLKKEDIECIIDSEAMQAGDSIEDFIKKSIQHSTIILSLVSNKSLQSAWVAMETLLSAESLANKNKRFIACLIEKDYFELDYTNKTNSKLKTEIEKIDKLIQEASSNMLDTQDLNIERSRLLALYQNLDKIVRTIRASLTLSMEEKDFDASMKKILNIVQEK